jgi:hypothetical protein
MEVSSAPKHCGQARRLELPPIMTAIAVVIARSIPEYFARMSASE